MKTIRFFAILFMILFSASWLSAQEGSKPLPEWIGKKTFIFAVKDTSILRMDIYQLKQADSTPQPVMLFMFGGSFARGNRDRDYYRDYFIQLAEKGFTVASIDYRLGMKDQTYNLRAVRQGLLGEAIQIAVEDLFSATNFLIDHAKLFNINPDSILASGSSAGAISVVQADWMIKNRMAGTELLPDGFSYKGIISFAGGIYSMIGRPKYAYGDPAPTLFIHGNRDRIVPYRTIRLFNTGMFTSKNLTRRFRRDGVDYAFIEFEGKDHGFGAGTAMTAGKPFIDWFLDRYIAADKGGQVKLVISNDF